MKIKGNILISRLAFVRENFGEVRLDQVLRLLRAQEQAILRGALDVNLWYPFEIGQRLDDAIQRIAGRGSSSIFEDMGAASAQQSLSGFQKFYLDPGNPQGFMLRAPLIYHVYYDKGRREYKPTGPNSGVMTTYEAETYSGADCLTVVGWYKRALAMCGAIDVQMVEETCRATGGDCCRYLVSWGGVVAL